MEPVGSCCETLMTAGAFTISSDKLCLEVEMSAMWLDEIGTVGEERVVICGYADRDAGTSGIICGAFRGNACQH